MEPLIALRGILLGAVPTFLLVWLLYWYVTRVFFRPLQETLQKRHQATEGLRAAAETNIAAAENKAAQYEESLRAARAELYQQQEQERQKAIEQRAEITRRARRQAEEMIAQARREFEQDAAEAKNRLAAESEAMARSIIRAILEPAASGRSAGETEARR
ncbi:MAG: ATP synthase F0 subunit B [Terriglobia bacterium]